MASRRRSTEFDRIELAVENWTPEDAAQALKKSHVNRSFRPYQAEKYATDMSDGRWGIADSVIGINTRGQLNNGYHRCQAQILSGATVTHLVARNVPPDAQDDWDKGLPRTLSDILTYMGIDNPQLAGAILKLIASILENRMTKSRSKLSTNQLLAILNDHPEIKTAVDVATVFRRDSATPIMPSVLGTAHWMISQVNGVNDASDFIERLSTLTGEVSGSAVIALSKRINEAKRMRTRLSQRTLLSAVIKAYNYDVEGKNVHKISIFPRSTKASDFELPVVKERKKTRAR